MNATVTAGDEPPPYVRYHPSESAWHGFCASDSEVEYAPGYETMERQAKKVLIVEDDPAIAELMETALEDSGFTTARAREGNEALRLVKEFRPTAITLDLALPGLDGRSFLHSLRSDGNGRRTPVIVVSAESDRLNAIERRSVAKVIQKPFDIGELIAAVKGGRIGRLTWPSGSQWRKKP